MSSEQKWKIAGLLFAAIPVGFFLMFAIGEGSGGWSHYIQAIIPALALYFAWHFPKLGGYVLIAMGVLACVSYVFLAASQIVWVTVLVLALAFAPLIASGVFFLVASKRALQ